MRVALVSPYALSVFGGVQEQTLAMSRELVRRGHVVLIVAPGVNDRTRYDTPAEVLRFGHVFSMPANGSKAPLTLSALAIRRAWFAIDNFKPDVVHFHEPFAPFIGWGALRTHAAPSVGTFHRSGDGPALRLTKPLLKLLAKDLDATAAVSESAALTIRQVTGLSPEVLFNGFEMTRFTAQPRERGEDTVLVTLGRLEERKGTAHVVQAVRAHNARGGDQWRLVVLGDGPQRHALEALSAHDEMVLFAGAVNDEQKRGWLRRANALIAPALRGESFGLILLEAMASETTVVASDIDGYRAAAGGHATLFAPGDEVALEHAINEALAGETKERIGAARDHAASRSMSTLMDAYEVLYATARRHFEAAR